MDKSEIVLKLEQLLKDCSFEHSIVNDSEDSLIELNLDSIQAIKLLVAIEEQFGVVISDKDYDFENFKSFEKIINLLERYNV
ncbi:acyl carrier protein [Paenibacillus oleatilyticus]|uniref:Acyl carrier protein n=1 Tax=Paenibacillus oleatilyticus TaxID=2594886 RepID=A0ABV4VA40_9BACL